MRLKPDPAEIHRPTEIYGFLKDSRISQRLTDIDARSGTAQTVAMGMVVGRTLTDALWSRLSGPAAEAFAHQAIPLCTIDADGWPHVALVSNSELGARERTRLDLLLYPRSGTSENLRQRRRCTLIFFDAGLAAYVKATAREYPAELTAQFGRAAFELRIDEVIVDGADGQHEAEAQITSGIAFTAAPPFEAGRQQMRAALAALRSVDGAR